MAKRFTDTDIWRKKWFRDLHPSIKLFFYFLKDNCNHAGVWEEDMESAEFHMGCKLDKDKILQSLPDHIQMIQDNKWFLNKFITFQYGDLNENCNPHKAVIRTLKRYKLRVGEPLKKDKSRVKDKEQEQDKDQAKEEKIKLDEFNKWWDLYNKKVGKPKAEKYWKNKTKHSDMVEIFNHTKEYIKANEKRFRKDPYSYLYNNTWKDEVIQDLKEEEERVYTDTEIKNHEMLKKQFPEMFKGEHNDKGRN